jgi:hypothetical protein
LHGHDKRFKACGKFHIRFFIEWAADPYHSRIIGQIRMGLFRTKRQQGIKWRVFDQCYLIRSYCKLKDYRFQVIKAFLSEFSGKSCHHLSIINPHPLIPSPALGRGKLLWTLSHSRGVAPSYKYSATLWL